MTYPPELQAAMDKKLDRTAPEFLTLCQQAFALGWLCHERLTLVGDIGQLQKEAGK
jgi:hypothetical protein